MPDTNLEKLFYGEWLQKIILLAEIQSYHQMTDLVISARKYYLVKYLIYNNYLYLNLTKSTNINKNWLCIIST